MQNMCGSSDTSKKKAQGGKERLLCSYEIADQVTRHKPDTCTCNFTTLSALPGQVVVTLCTCIIIKVTVAPCMLVMPHMPLSGTSTGTVCA